MALSEEEYKRELDRFRGKMCGLIESWGLQEKQERAAISLMKTLSYDLQAKFWARLDD